MLGRVNGKDRERVNRLPASRFPGVVPNRAEAFEIGTSR